MIVKTDYLIQPRWASRDTEYGIDPQEFGRTDVLFELIPISAQDIEYLDGEFRASLRHQFSDGVDLPMALAMMDDVQVGLITSAAEAILSVERPDRRIPRSEQYECSMIAESWLSDHLRTYALSVGDEAYVLGVSFPVYMRMIDRFSVSTALSAVVGRVPRVIKLDDGDMPEIKAGLYLSYPFFGYR